MVNTPGVTAPKTPPHGVTAASQLKSTPNAVGSATISERISAVGTEVGDVRPWITRDVEDFRECHPDTILQKLLDDCKYTFVPPIEKSKLFEDSLQAVVQLCNDQKIKGHVEDFANCTLENGSYTHFIQAANAALLELRSLKVSGLRDYTRNDEHWGLNTEFKHVPGESCEICVRDADGDVDLKFDLMPGQCTTHFGLRGRALYIIVSKKLLPITTLSGDEFLAAWWQVVLCHYVLWQHGVRHRDASPSNLKVYKTSDGRYIGVLNDYDLSSTQGTPTGNFERTGTVPFMAIDLLSPAAIAGQVEHLYRHDAESLVWVLAWICMRYEKVVLLREGRPLDDWLRVNALRCAEKKSDFLLRIQTDDPFIQPTSSHQDNWDVALSCLDSIIAMRSTLSKRAKVKVVLDDNSAFQTLLKANVPSWLHT